MRWRAKCSLTAGTFQSVVKPPPELTVRSKRVAEPTAGSEGGPARQDADALAGGWGAVLVLDPSHLF